MGVLALVVTAVVVAYFCCKRPPGVGSSDYNVDKEESHRKYNAPVGKQSRVWQHLVREEQGSSSWGELGSTPDGNKAASVAPSHDIVSSQTLHGVKTEAFSDASSFTLDVDVQRNITFRICKLYLNIYINF